MQAKLTHLAPLTIAAITLWGCNKDGVQQAVNVGVEQASQVVEQTVETVKQEANLVGSMDLATNPPLSAKACYAELIVTDEARPNVFRLASYKSSDLERFPSVILEAHVQEASLQELVGKSVQAKVYAQNEEEGAVWSTPNGSLANVSVIALADGSLTCECAAAPLVNSDTGEQASAAGKFVAVVE